MSATSPGQAGHRSLAHTADVQVEAWAPTRDQCVAQAALGIVETFLDIGATVPTGRHHFRVDVGPGDARHPDEDLLVAVLEELVFLLDTAGLAPVQVVVTTTVDAADVVFETIEAGSVTQLGAVPKAISLHELRIGGDSSGWTCLVTVDV